MKKKWGLLLLLATILTSLMFWSSDDIKSGRSPASESPMLKDFKIAFGYTAADVPYVGRWKDYFQAIGMLERKKASDSGYGNQAMSQFNLDRFEKNPCFLKLAGYFYEEIQRRDLKFYAENDFSRQRIQTRPSLADEAGKGVYSAVKPGWLWELAQKYAQGDKSLAIQLLGVCGHDDNTYLINFPELSKSVESRREKHLDFYEKHYVEDFCGFDKAVVTNDKCFKAYMAYKNKTCPQLTSLMFLPKSLGDKFDVNESLKRKVASIQAPNLGANALPAKYYHVIGSAFSSCLALSRCPEGFLCPQIFSQGHHLGLAYYRATAICERLVNAEANTEILNFIESKYKDFRNICSSVDRKNIEGYFAKITRNDCPSDWSSNRCAAVLEKIKTFLVDFEWSRSQHQVGIDFARAQCPRIGSDGDQLTQACAAVELLEATPVQEGEFKGSSGTVK